jgi:hypothetical protein
LHPLASRPSYLAAILSEKLTGPDSAPTEDLLIGALAATTRDWRAWFCSRRRDALSRHADDVGQGRVEKFPPPLDPTFAKVLAAAKNGENPGWSRPVFVTGAKATYASAHAPVFSGGVFRGVVIAGVSMERLSGLVSKISARRASSPSSCRATGCWRIRCSSPAPAILKPGIAAARQRRLRSTRCRRHRQGREGGSLSLHARPDVNVRIASNVRGNDWVIITKPLAAYGPLDLTVGAYVSLDAVDAPLSRLIDQRQSSA